MMEQDEIIIRLLNESDIDQVNDLHNRLYKDNRNEEEFRWEFFNAPAGKAIYIIAEDPLKKKIVGTQCAIPVYLEDKEGKKILSAKSEDTLVDPEYRGRQIFEKMYALLFDECRKNDIRAIWGFTAALKPFVRLAFDIPFSHEQCLLARDITKAYSYLSSLNPENKKRDKFKIFILTLLSKSASFRIHFTSGRSGIFKSTVSKKIRADLHKLLNKISVQHEGLFFIREDMDFINWRINDNPYHENIYCQDFYQENSLVAHILFNHHKDDIWYLVQALFYPDLSEKEKKRILRDAVKDFIVKETPALVRTWSFRNNSISRDEIRLLKATGFFHLKRGVHFVWKRLDDDLIIDPKNFLLSRIATQGTI